MGLLVHQLKIGLTATNSIRREKGIKMGSGMEWVVERHSSLNCKERFLVGDVFSLLLKHLILYFTLHP